MSEFSPVTSSDVGPINDGLLACQHLQTLSETRDKFQEFLVWMLTDPTGELSTDFKTALTRQMLFDASKKGYIAGSDEGSGYLRLFSPAEFGALIDDGAVPLTALDNDGVSTGDLITVISGVWARHTPVYAAPSSGGTTIPLPAAGGILTVAHNLGTTPRSFRCYLECATADANWAVGDRVDAQSLRSFNGAAEFIQGVDVFANSTLVGAVFRGLVGSSYHLIDKSGFNRTAITPGSWNVKLYATY